MLGKLIILMTFLVTFQVYGNPSIGGGTKMAKSESVKICYVPLYLETYMPLTKGNIEEHSRCMSVSMSSNVVVALQGLLSDAITNVGSAEKFDDEKVRVMLRMPFGLNAFYVDQSGGVVSGRKQGQLAGWHKAALEVILNCLFKGKAES